MTVSQFQKWLRDKIAWLQDFPSEERDPEDRIYAQEFIEEAYHYAVDLKLSECAEACKSGPATIQLMECLNAIPTKTTMLSPPEIARELGVSTDKVRGWCRSGRLTATNTGNGRARWKVKRDDLDMFLKGDQPEKPAKKRKPKLLVNKY